MSEDYYKARIGELEREVEAAHAENVRLSGKSGYCVECERLARELAQAYADIKILEDKQKEKDEKATID